MVPKCPEVTVQLTGINGNAFVILGAVISEMKSMRVDKEIIDEFKREATSGNYDHLLQTVMRYVNVE